MCDKKEDCQCDICKDGKKFREVLSRITSEDDKKYLEDFYGRWMNADENETYWKLRFKGDWPTEEAAARKLIDVDFNQGRVIRGVCKCPIEVMVKKADNSVVYWVGQNATRTGTLEDLEELADKAMAWAKAMRLMIRISKGSDSTRP